MVIIGTGQDIQISIMGKIIINIPRMCILGMHIFVPNGYPLNDQLIYGIFRHEIDVMGMTCAIRDPTFSPVIRDI